MYKHMYFQNSINPFQSWKNQIWPCWFCCSFSSFFLPVLSCTTQKYRNYTNVLHVKWLLMFLFWFRAAFELWLVKYSSKQTSQSLSKTPFLHTYIYNLKTTGYVQISTIKLLLYNWSHSFCALELHERSKQRAMAPDVQCGCSLIQHCVLTVSISINIHDTYNCTTIQSPPLPPRMIVFDLKVPKIVITGKQWSGTYIPVSLFGAQLHMSKKLT